MSGRPIVTKQGPRTYTPADNAVITGGHLVEAVGTDRVQLASAASVKTLGIAVIDGIAPEDLVLTPTVVAGRSVLNTAVLPTHVSVVYGGMEAPCEYAAAAAFGDPLVAAANGRVTPAGATPDARTIVGRCTQPGGVSGAGVYGLVRTV